ncbi:MAG: hypothetical protein VKO00_04205 [Cyanobacteriota bacterium]|nr:hypothetical protein [Cyanobacteriota bacterium]
MPDSSRDPRSSLEARLRDNQLTYSLQQLRLVGVLLLLLLLGRLLVFFFTGLHVAPIARLSALGSMANWLPLLPLAISLYLLGAGRSRPTRAATLACWLHYSLLPLALLCLAVLPGTMVWDLQNAALTAPQPLSPYQIEIISPLRSATAMVLSLLAGVGLLLLYRQSAAEIRRHGLTPAIFFKADAVRTSSRRRRRY